MRRFLLVTCALAAAGLAGAGVWFLLRRNGTAKTLARAQVALRASRPEEALRLADDYVRRVPGDWRGYLIQGQAGISLRDYLPARRALRKALELNPTESSTTMALAKTYILPALQVLEGANATCAPNELEAGVKLLEQANEVLASAEAADEAAAVAFRQMAASNTMYMARIYHRMSESLGTELALAQAGHATERLEQILRRHEAARETARRLELTAVANLRGVLAEARQVLAGQLTEPQRKLLTKHADRAARDLVRFCIDFNYIKHRDDVGEALVGLDGISPVAATLAVVQEVRTGRHSSASERREALVRACRRIDRLQELASDRKEDRKEILLSRASLALALKDYETAVRICEQVLEETPNQPTARLFLAEAMLARGRFAQAEQELFVLRTESPDSADVAFAHGRAAEAVGKAELARGAVQTAVKLNPRHTGAQRHLVERYLRDGYLDQAYTQAQEYYSNCKSDPAALRMLVEAAHATGRRAAAERALAQTLADFSDEPRLLMTACEAYALLGDRARSMEAARKAARASPVGSTCRLAVARALIMTGQTARAESMLDRLMADESGLAPAHFELARLYTATGRLLHAAEEYQAAADIEPGNVAYRLASAGAMLQMGCLERCRNALEGLPPDHARANYLRLQLRLLEGKPLSAAEAIANVKASGGSPRGLALALLNVAPARCLEVCLSQLQEPDAEVEWRILAGEASLALGRLGEAREHWKAALAAAPVRVDVYLRLARLLARSRPAGEVRDELAACPGARWELAALAASAASVQRGGHTDAAEILRDLVGKKDSSRWTRNRARLMLAKCLAFIGDNEGAIVELEALAGNGRLAEEALLAKAELLAGADRSEQAMEILAGLRSKAKARGDAELLGRVIDRYAASGKIEQALSCCDDILAAGADLRRASLIKARLHRADRRPELAAECYRQAIAALPNDPAARLGLADSLAQQFKTAEAWRALEAMESLGKAGCASAAFAKAELARRWGLHEQAVESLRQLERLGYGDVAGVRLALGRTLAAVGQPTEARENLRRVRPNSTEYVDAQIALADLADCPAEARRILDKLAASHDGSEKVLERALTALLADGKPHEAVGKFRAFIDAHCGDGSRPGAAAFLALQAMLETRDFDAACQLSRRLAAQSREPTWRRIAKLVSPRAEAAGKGGESSTEPPDVLIDITNASRFKDAAALKEALERFESVRREKPEAFPPTYRLLVALLANDSRSPQTAARAPEAGDPPRVSPEALVQHEPHDRAMRILKDTSPWELPAAVREAAAALLACEDRQRQKKQAVDLMRAGLALDLKLNGLARRIAMRTLSADPACQWAALLAVAARKDTQTLRKVLSLMQPDDCAVKLVVEAEMLLIEGKYEQSAQAFGRAAELAQCPLDLQFKQAVAMEKAGRLGDALELYRQVHSSARGELFAGAANNAAHLAARIRPKDRAGLLEAYAWSADAVKTCPNSPEFRDTRGWLAHLLGRKEEACLELRRALGGMSSSPEVHAHLAEAEAAAGNRDLARWHRRAAERLLELTGAEPATIKEAGRDVTKTEVH